MVPHATADDERRRSTSDHQNTKTFKFPDLDVELHPEDEEALDEISRGPSPAPLANGLPPGLHSSERWPLKRDPRQKDRHSGESRAARHGRQKSLSEAIKTVRTRHASISENAHEIAESLKAPVSVKLVLLCGFWYTASILTNTSSKTILTAFSKPVTLTIVQFFLVSFWCVFFSSLAKRHASVRTAMPVLKNGIRRPNRDIIMSTLPLTAFQVAGHILNSDAMSRVPVSLVHTIKGLSPLMTVFAHRIFLNIRYSLPTYLSLIPLTLGVVMACSASFRGNLVGLANAFGSAVLFVTQNIVSKRIFDQADRAEADGTPIGRRKPDKLNLLCYSSGLALLCTLPIWLWSEGFSLAADYLQDGTIDLREKPGSLDHGRLAVEFLLNGTFHFAQSLVAFVLIGMVSPVTYSVASLIKRVAVIMFAIVWFGNPMTRIQGIGFAFTFAGLYLYDRTSDAAKADRRAREKAQHAVPLLPINTLDPEKAGSAAGSSFVSSPMSAGPLSARSLGQPFGGINGFAAGEPADVGPGRPQRSSDNSPVVGLGPPSLPPGTKAEQTWTQDDVARQKATAVR